MNYKKLYFGLVSIASLLAFLIPSAVTLGNILEKVLISDKEYVMNDYSYTNCSNNDYRDWVSVPRSEEDIASCQEKEMKKGVENRNYRFKRDLVETLPWILVFAIVFGFHYKSFRKED